MRVVIDTNVVVSALLNPYGNPAKVFQLVRENKLTLLTNSETLNEYREVLRRPELNLQESEVDEVLALVDFVGEFAISTPLTFSLPDPDDIFLLELALGGEADILITGNKKDFKHSLASPKIMNPAEFLEFYRNHLAHKV